MRSTQRSPGCSRPPAPSRLSTTGETTTGETTTGSTCGDGAAEADEDCDGEDLGGQDCASQGFVDGVLLCNKDCTFDTSMCTDVACGDDVAEDVTGQWAKGESAGRRSS